MPEVIDRNNPPPAPPPGPPPDTHSEATALARLRAMRQPAPEPQAEAAPEAAPRADRAPDGKFKKRDEPSAEQAAEPSFEAAPDEPQAEAESEEPTAKELATLNDLAEHLGVEVGDLYSLRIPIDVDGTKEEVSLSEWKDSYRAKKQTELEHKRYQEERAAIEAQRKAIEEQHRRNDEKTQAWILAATNLVQSKYQHINWQDLRANDPGQYAALQADYHAEMRQLDSIAGQHLQAIADRKAADEAQTEQQKIANRQKEHAALRDSIKEWRDEKTYRDESRKVFEYGAAQGWEPQQLASLGDRDGDHRIVSLMRKAMLYDQAAEKAKAALKPAAVKIGQRVIKPGPRSNAATGPTAEAKQAMNQLRKTGDWRDALNALKASRRVTK